MSLISRWILPLALLLAASGALAAPGNESGGAFLGGGEHDGTVRASLLTEQAAIAPGSTFSVGIAITMEPGWHTYWENGGDAGLATSVEWTLPEGFSAGPIQWPLPHRYEDEGDIVTFGYARETLLIVDMTAPESVEPGSHVTIDGRVDWLQCKDICIPGGADLSIRLPVEAAPRPSPGPVVARFDETRDLHPVAAASLEDVGLHPFQSLDAIPAGTTAKVAVVLEGLDEFDPETAEFFPRPSDQLWLRDGTFHSDGKNLALVIPVEVDSSVEPGSVVMLGAVISIPQPDGADPLVAHFDLPVTVAEEGDIPLPSTDAVFTNPDGPLLASTSAAAPSAAPAGGLLRFLVLAFFGGVILNVMPCVLPVISLKILGFVSQANENPGKIARLGLTFAGGVIASFLVLALAVIALQSAGEHIGWGFQFQSPGFVAALAVVVFVFSLSLLGVFEVGGIVAIAGLGAASTQRKEYADSFFHGVLTTILATPCTAPMLGAAIAFALVQPPAVILLIFFTVALGLAAPYVLLSLNPAWLKFVPKPGAWMDTFKQAMGFVLLATLVWLLFVFGAQTGADGLTWMLAFLLVVGFFAWVHGRFLNLLSSTRRVVAVWVFTIAGVGWGYQAFLHEFLFPPAEAAGYVTASLSPRSEVSDGGIVWEPFSVAYLDESVNAGRTVFIDFTADWCFTCKVNEKTVLAHANVESLFRENDVLTLKGDWTRKDPAITEILQRHQRAGVPFYAVYPAGRPEDVIVLPEIINQKLVLESLQKAGPSRSGA